MATSQSVELSIFILEHFLLIQSILLLYIKLAVDLIKLVEE